ncbi:MAG TPA: DUF4385 domain-containing protein [Tepidisphaeraceae bacterium]
MTAFPDPHVDYRLHPEQYRVGRGERGVLTVQPYKGELLPHWRFKTPAEAKASAATLYKQFLRYVKANDFVGADMARKFIQMGWTRARRYANHAGGRKYKPGTREVLPPKIDPIKAESAAIFFETLGRVRKNAGYLRLAAAHKTQVAGVTSGAGSKNSSAAPRGRAAAAANPSR